MIDTSIQLNNHNSYHATELFWADTFSVQTMSHITVSFALYSDVVQAAANRIKIRFYTAGGATVSETSHAFAVNTIWERVSATVAVPATAEKAQICFLAGSYWWAEAKVEEGQTATPYAINAAGQLTWISPNGIYTGTVTAQQVIVSPLSGSTEKDLESRLVTINSNAINLKATTDNNVSRLTTIEAGQASFVKFDDLGTPNGTYINGGNVKTGKIESVDGTSYFDLTNGKIKSNDVDLTGTINAINGNIGGLVVSPNALTITVSKVFGPFAQADVDRVQAIIYGATPTAADFDKYDLPGSGRINVINLSIMGRMIGGTYGFTNPMTVAYEIKFSTSGTNNLLTLKSDKFSETTILRPASVETSHGIYQTLIASGPFEAGSIESENGYSANGVGGASGSFRAKNTSGADITVTVNGGIITSIG